MDTILNTSRSFLYDHDSIDKSSFFREIAKRNFEDTSLNNKNDLYKDKEITLNHFGWFNTSLFLI